MREVPRAGHLISFVRVQKVSVAVMSCPNVLRLVPTRRRLATITEREAAAAFSSHFGNAGG